MNQYGQDMHECIIHPAVLNYKLLQPGDQKPPGRIQIKTEKKFGLQEGRSIVCKNCGNRVTSSESIVSVDGHHIHTFTNPSGITYEIGCFNTAEGCAIDMDPTVENTWFEGFTWSMSICSNCLIHLGWFYERGNESFFGLITDHLVDSSATER